MWAAWRNTNLQYMIANLQLLPKQAQTAIALQLGSSLKGKSQADLQVTSLFRHHQCLNR